MFAAGTVVSLLEGVKNVENLSVGDSVLTNDGTTRTIQSVSVQPDTDLFSMCYKGLPPLACDANQYLVLTGGLMSVVQAFALMVGGGRQLSRLQGIGPNGKLVFLRAFDTGKADGYAVTLEPAGVFCCNGLYVHSEND